MGFRLVGSILGASGGVAVPKDNQSYLLTDNEGSTEGQVFKFSSGRLTKAATNAGDAACIALETVAGGTNQKARIEWLMPGGIYRATVTGAKHANFVVGLRARLDADGKNINWADVTDDGPFFVTKIVDGDVDYVEGFFVSTALMG